MQQQSQVGSVGVAEGSEEACDSRVDSVQSLDAQSGASQLMEVLCELMKLNASEVLAEEPLLQSLQSLADRVHCEQQVLQLCGEEPLRFETVVLELLRVPDRVEYLLLDGPPRSRQQLVEFSAGRFY